MTLAELDQDCRRREDRRITALHPLASDLANAIEHGEIEIQFQPQFGAASNMMVGAEALVRWPHETRGRLAGDELVAIAARSKLTQRLSHYIMQRAMNAAAQWRGELRLSLNVTAADLAARDFIGSITDALEESGFDPERLTVEITEQALVSELESSAEKLRDLVSKGVRVALDDFGAGFCNFKYLKVLPLHYLKLDRSMVEGIADDARDLAVLRGIMAMANALDLSVIAEGIETEAQRETIVREGCACWQGFLGAKPVKADEFQAFVAT